MDPSHWKRGLALAALTPLLAGLVVGCSDKTTPAAKSDACGTLPSADAAAKLPTGIPELGGQVLYEPSVQGKTTIVYGLLNESSFVSVRDELVTKLKAAGWTIDGTDQESVEAEAQFSKANPLRTGTVKVEPLCKGYVTIRYKVNE
jgi:hypothetical protein